MISQKEKRKWTSSIDGVKQQCLGIMSSCEAAVQDFSNDAELFKDEIQIMQNRRTYMQACLNQSGLESSKARLDFNAMKARFKQDQPDSSVEDLGDGTSTAQARALANTAPPCQNYEKLNLFDDMKTSGEQSLEMSTTKDFLQNAIAANNDQKKYITELMGSVKKAVTDLYHARTNHRRAARDQAQAETNRLRDLADAQAGAEQRNTRQKKDGADDVFSLSHGDK